MANSFEAIASSGSAEDPPAWIVQLQTSSGFAVTDWATVTKSIDPETHGTEDAVAAAYREGEAAGRAAMTAELADADASRARLKVALEGFNSETTAALKAALTKTVVTLCGQIIEPALIDHEALNSRCADAISRLGSAQDELTLHLHPDDLPLVDMSKNSGPKLVANPSLDRGSIRLDSPNGTLSDGPEDWRRIIGEALNQ